MSSRDNADRPNLTSNAINRRNMLLAGTTLAAASAVTTGGRVQVAQAQQPAAPSTQSD